MQEGIWDFINRLRREQREFRRKIRIEAKTEYSAQQRRDAFSVIDNPNFTAAPKRRAL